MRTPIAAAPRTPRHRNSQDKIRGTSLGIAAKIHPMIDSTRRFAANSTNFRFARSSGTESFFGKKKGTKVEEGGEAETENNTAASKASGAKTLSATEEATTERPVAGDAAKEATALLKTGTVEGDPIKAAKADYEAVDGHHDRAPWSTTPRVPAAKKEAVPVKPSGSSGSSGFSGFSGLKNMVAERMEDDNGLEMLNKAADLISERLRPDVTEESGKLRLDATTGWYEVRRRMVFSETKRTLPGT